MHKGKGMVREVFRTRNMRDLIGNAGIAHVRYPTAGNAGSSAEAQPFYVSSPFGIVLAHNGNLTNTRELMDAVHATSGEDLSGELGRGSSTDTAVLAALLNLVSERGALEGWDSPPTSSPLASPTTPSSRPPTPRRRP